MKNMDKEIRRMIDANNSLIENLMTPGTFTLNKTVAELLQKNHELQEKCSHIFINGRCIACDWEEGKE